MSKHGDLRVWWMPQIPMKPFVVPVRTLREARFLLVTLADYDAFQFANKIKPDFCNGGGLQIYDTTDEEPGWLDWWDDEGNDFADLTDEQIDVLDAKEITDAS
jgi:hypothetical protein